MTTSETTIHKLKLNDPWFDFVKHGEKIYEGRLNSEKVKTYKVGDLLEFSNYTDSSRNIFYKTIKDIHHYHTFRDALNDLGLEKILPNVTSV